MDGGQLDTVGEHAAREPADGAASGRGRHGPTERLIEEVLPALIARLGVGRLAELEVRSEDWRVRLRRDPRTALAHPDHPARLRLHAAVEGDAEDDVGVARSPAVGYFSPTADLQVGRPVRAGDMLGRVDVLGVAHDVTSPVDGVIGRILVEPGQAVEYGQPLALVDPDSAKA